MAADLLSMLALGCDEFPEAPFLQWSDTRGG
jgi:hypothetical protein